MRQRLARAGLWAAAAMVGVATLMLYAQPGFLVAVSDLVWACFN